MNRRSFLATAGGAALTGCLADQRAHRTRSTTVDRTETPTGTARTAASTRTARTETPTGSGTYASQPSGPEPYPDRPDEPTRDAATTYVEEFERVRTYNALHDEDVEDLSVDSRTVYDTAAHGGHHVLASGSGYANYAGGVHADGGRVPALYFVGPDLTVRVADYEDRYFHCSEVFADDDPAETFAEECEGTHAESHAYNLHTEPHVLSVTVSLVSDRKTRRVLEREYELETTDGVQQGSVTRRRGV